MFSPGVKWPGHEVDRSSMLRIRGSILPLSHTSYCAVINESQERYLLSEGSQAISFRTVSYFNYQNCKSQAKPKYSLICQS